METRVSQQRSAEVLLSHERNVPEGDQNALTSENNSNMMSSHASGEPLAPETGSIEDQIAREQERVVQLSRQLELKNLKDKAKILKRQVLENGAMTDELR